MAKLTRQSLIQFGRDGGTSNFGKFGSQAAASPVETKDIPTIQALAAWLNGWQDAVAIGQAPYLQDMNGLLYVFGYQLCYGLQEGIPEYDSSTTYFIGSIVKKTGTSQLYMSAVNNNLSNALPDQVSNSNWTYLQTGQTVSMRAHNVAGTTLTINTDNVVPFASVDFDSLSTWTTDNTFTAPVPGKYLVDASLQTNATGWSVGDYLSLQIKKNSTVVSYRLGLIQTTSSVYTDPGISDTLSLAAGDTVQIIATPQKATGGNVTLNNGLGANHVAITRIGN